MDHRAWIKLKESLNKLPPLDQRIALERELNEIDDPNIKQEIIKALAVLPPTLKLEGPPPKIKENNNAWKSLGKSVDELAVRKSGTEEQEEQPRLAEFKTQTPTLDALVEESPVKKEEEPLEVTYGGKQASYGEKKEDYKPAELKPGGTPAEVFRQEQDTSFEDREDFTKSAAERELKKTEKYKRFGTKE